MRAAIATSLGLLLGLGLGFTAQAQTAEISQPQTAIFASGCFWCTESDFEKLDGVISAQSGYTGGDVVEPSYEQVSAGGTGHTEAVLVTFDPATVSYQQLLDHYWHNVDPTVQTNSFVITVASIAVPFFIQMMLNKRRL